MPTLSDVARAAGVSVATASLALRGRGRVGQETAHRIRKVADELGYVPNPLLASLATRRFRSQQSIEGTPLAILEFSQNLPRNSAGALSHYSRDMEPFARQLGYSPSIYRLDNNSPTAPLFRELYHRMVQGVVVVGSMDMDKFGARMPWEHFPVVACARFAHSLPFHTVRPNIFQGIKTVFDQLRARGYKRIGFALGQHSPPIEDDEARHGAAIALVNNYLGKADRIAPYSGSIEDLDGFLRWCKKTQPEVVVGFSEGNYWKLRDAGLAIPQDIGFACLHLDTPEGSKGLSGVYQNRQEIARQTILQLDQLIRNRERGLPALPLHILVPSQWVEGQSLRPPPT